LGYREVLAQAESEGIDLERLSIQHCVAHYLDILAAGKFSNIPRGPREHLKRAGLLETTSYRGRGHPMTKLTDAGRELLAGMLNPTTPAFEAPP